MTSHDKAITAAMLTVLAALLPVGLVSGTIIMLLIWLYLLGLANVITGQ